MAGRGNPSFLKNQKAQKRTARAAAKRADRAARRAERAAGREAEPAPEDMLTSEEGDAMTPQELENPVETGDTP
jgi:septal ring factor EnvC (AmiA/AmiB activator)